MKERPILFSGPMVRAILEGRKTQTRRIVKAQGELEFLGGSGDPKTDPANWGWGPDDDGEYCSLVKNPFAGSWARCPYGVPGDRLWVKEKWRPVWHEELFCCVQYAADSSYRKPEIDTEERGFRFADMCDVSGDNAEPWHSSLHMWREFSRLTLTIADVRVERLQDISEEDAIAEGIERFTKDDKVFKYWPTDPADRPIRGLEMTWQDMPHDPRVAFAALWNHVNGPGSWEANPWVWVIEFKRAEVRG
ncbi:MAG: hypothetical protein JSS51_07740 [Planctomycetes bacterium]|nr:hypothetical protein [Planctomycetota bacterium]